MESSWMPCGLTTLAMFTQHIIIILLSLNILRWYVGIPLLRECSALCDFIFGKLSEDVIQSPAILANVFGFTIPRETQVHLGYTIRKDATAYRLWCP
jgi:predicted permease